MASLSEREGTEPDPEVVLFLSDSQFAAVVAALKFHADNELCGAELTLVDNLVEELEGL